MLSSGLPSPLLLRVGVEHEREPARVGGPEGRAAAPSLGAFEPKNRSARILSTRSNSMAVMGADSTPIAAARAIMRNVDRIVSIAGRVEVCARETGSMDARGPTSGELVPENNTLRQIAPVGMCHDRCDHESADSSGEGSAPMSDIPIWE